MVLAPSLLLRPSPAHRPVSPSQSRRKIQPFLTKPIITTTVQPPFSLPWGVSVSELTSLPSPAYGVFSVQKPEFSVLQNKNKNKNICINTYI